MVLWLWLDPSSYQSWDYNFLIWTKKYIIWTNHVIKPLIFPYLKSFKSILSRLLDLKRDLSKSSKFVLVLPGVRNREPLQAIILR